MQAAQTRYSHVAIALHWLIALGIIANICLGLFFDGLPGSDPDKFWLAQTHKSIGLTVLSLSVLRVLWRLMNPVPPLPESMPAILRFAAHVSHVLLYVLILAIPLTGWALVSSSPLGLPTMYFGWFVWPHLPYLAELPRATKKIVSPEFHAAHHLLAWSAIVLIPIHVLAALYHHFLRRDDVLGRMIPGLKPTSRT